MTDHICSEIQYGPIHSDLCGTDLSDQDWRNLLHSALDEWLNNSNGDGCFYVGDVQMFANEQHSDSTFEECDGCHKTFDNYRVLAGSFTTYNGDWYCSSDCGKKGGW